MSKKNKFTIAIYLSFVCFGTPFIALSASETKESSCTLNSTTGACAPNLNAQLPVTDTTSAVQNSLAMETVAKQLGWIIDSDTKCDGYYLEDAFTLPVPVDSKDTIEITGNQGLVSQRGTSVLENKVTISRQGEQVTANKGYLYRDPITGKFSIIEMIGNVHLREPNTLIVAKKGRYNLETKAKSLMHLTYRTSLNGKRLMGPKATDEEVASERKITALTAWGRAYEFSQAEPRIFELAKASFSTCNPINPAWRIKASHIVLNKNSGRGYATNARLLVKNVPIFYSPYINFPIDSTRKSGFLWPRPGVNGKWGPYFYAPIYWNMAPNYDMIVTPGILTKSGLQLSDNFRYLSHIGTGNINFSILPSDKAFADFQTATKENPEYSTSTNTTTQAELSRLLNSSTTRKALFWRDDSQFNPHWSSHVDFNYAGDDYYLRDFGNGLNEVTANYLLQEADLYYKGQNWDFTGRLQTYQTLHPIDTDAGVLNQYRRFPQLILNGDYPDQAYGLDYFINSEVTHFDIRNTPGTDANQPIGNRVHVQPGIALPFTLPYFFLTPRVQLAMTQYQLYQNSFTAAPNSKRRTVPIFGLGSGLSFHRYILFLHEEFEQTLEPQLYYTYIPYRNQASIPIFDTTINTLTYDQIFNYNRFSGIDRIGDADQLGLGVSTRFIDRRTGIERVRIGVGDIIYFSNRHVTFCNDQSCTDNPTNANNHYGLSPLSGLLNYHVNDAWNLNVNSIWNPITKQMDNTSAVLHYQPEPLRIINFGFSFVRNGDYLSGINVNAASQNNLKLTDFSFAWPVSENISVVGRWTEDWNTHHFQNLLYGVQYDTCCWAVRAVGGRTFTNLATNNVPQYTPNYYIEFNLKGLGNIGPDPAGLLSSITGYNTQFGQEI